MPRARDHALAHEPIEQRLRAADNSRASGSRVVRMTADTIERLKPPVNGEPGFYSIDSSVEPVRWNEVVLRFGGNGWRRFLCPDNVGPS
jgi:hypothetical protein